MKKIILLALMLGSIGIAHAQVGSVITAKANELSGNFTKFTVIDQTTGYALGKTPAIYKPGENAPQVYFTKAPTELINQPGLYVSINDATSSEEGYWCLAYEVEEKMDIFVRRRFMTKKLNAIWTPIVEGDYVIFKRAMYKQYLTIDKDGKFSETTDLSVASRWELIYM